MFGGRAASWKTVNSGRYGRSENLSVRFFPNSVGSPCTSVDVPGLAPGQLLDAGGAGKLLLQVIVIEGGADRRCGLYRINKD